MNRAVLSPHLLFIDEQEWLDAERRDQFLEDLLDHLAVFRDFQIGRVQWTDDLEETLWAAPQVPPWRQDQIFRVPLTNTVRSLFQASKEILPVPGAQPEASLDPPQNCSCGRQECFDATLRLISHLLETGLNWSWLVDRCCCHLTTGALTASHPNGISFKPAVICGSDGWFADPNCWRWFWPEAGVREEEARLKNGLAVYTRVHLGTLNEGPQQDYYFTERCLEDLATHYASGEGICFALAKRLRLGQSLAAADGGLQDEQVQTSIERRFRVNGVCRIHYAVTSGRIEFRRYYGAGEHDDGL